MIYSSGRRALLAASFFLFAIVALPANAQGTVVRGIVRDSVSQAPVRGARVMLVRGSQTVAMTNTDNSGAFSLAADGSAHSVSVTAFGFRPITLSVATDGAPLTIQLTTQRPVFAKQLPLLYCVADGL